MISSENYKNFLQLKGSDVYDLSFKTLCLYGEILDIIDESLYGKEVRIKLNKEEKSIILNGFFETIDPKFKDKYNELVNKNNIKIVRKIDRDKDIMGQMCDLGVPSNREDQIIKLTKQKNDFIFLSTLIHELTHAVEYDEIKEVLTDDDKYCNYVNNSLYTEVLPVYYEAKFCDYLDSIGINKDIIRHLKRRIICEAQNGLNEIYNIESYHNFKNNTITCKDGFTKYKNSDLFYSIECNYAFLLQMYLNNIEDEEEKIKVIDKFNKIKYDNYGIEIFDKLGCDTKTLYKSIKRQVVKCK